MQVSIFYLICKQSLHFEVVGFWILYSEHLDNPGWIMSMEAFRFCTWCPQTHLYRTYQSHAPRMFRLTPMSERNSFSIINKIEQEPKYSLGTHSNRQWVASTAPSRSNASDRMISSSPRCNLNHQSKSWLSWADCGTFEIQVNPTGAQPLMSSHSWAR